LAYAVAMPEVDDAVKLVTDPANVSELGVTGPQRQFAVNRKRVIKALRDAGAGKAEARDLALEALEKVEGGAEIRAGRGTGPAGARGDVGDEHWWVPASAIRFQVD
jgi:hypothetical protein